MLTMHFFSALTGVSLGHRHVQPPSALHGMRGRSRARRDYRKLQYFPDYLLKDVGLTRDQVGSAVRQPFFF